MTDQSLTPQTPVSVDAKIVVEYLGGEWCASINTDADERNYGFARTPWGAVEDLAAIMLRRAMEAK